MKSKPNSLELAELRPLKTFQDIEFIDHPIGSGKQGLIFFSNGYGVSVVRFSLRHGSYGSYTNDETEWELAVIKGTPEKWDLCYDSGITSDVIGYLSEQEVSNVMSAVQDL